MGAKLLQSTHSLWTCLVRNVVRSGENGSRGDRGQDEKYHRRRLSPVLSTITISIRMLGAGVEVHSFVS